MKKAALLLLTLLLALSLCACAGVHKTYTLERGGMTFTVDRENKTISDGSHTYGYSVAGNKDSYHVEITYPDGSVYHWTQVGDFGSGGWSEMYDESRYLSGEVLRDMVLEKAAVPPNPTKVTVAVLIMACGVFYALFPRGVWSLAYGWRYKSAEPSDDALVLNRVMGIIGIIVGVVIMILL